MDDGKEVGGRLLITGGDCSKAFEAMKEALDSIANPIEPLVGAALNRTRRVRGNDRLHSHRPGSLADFGRVVARIGDASFAVCVGKKVRSFGDLVGLPWSQRDVERLGFLGGGRDCVDFGRKTSSRTAQSIASDPPFPPAASWCARTMVPSRREPTSSTSTWSSLNNRSHLPRAAQRANRLYTVFQGPYRSGISRQGAPVFTRQTTALMNSRSPRLVGGPGRRPSSGRICCHWASVSSCRCTASVDQLFACRATWISTINREPNFRSSALRADPKIRDTP